MEYSNQTVGGKTEVLTFKWAYSNTYDSRRGTCDCVLTLVHKPGGVASMLEMVTERSETLRYNGYMEGSVDMTGILRK